METISIAIKIFRKQRKLRENELVLKLLETALFKKVKLNFVKTISVENSTVGYNRIYFTDMTCFLGPQAPSVGINVVKPQ